MPMSSSGEGRRMAVSARFSSTATLPRWASAARSSPRSFSATAAVPWERIERLPLELRAELESRFELFLEPLLDSGRLGAVLLQLCFAPSLAAKFAARPRGRRRCRR
jgi:hypothetical protein